MRLQTADRYDRSPESRVEISLRHEQRGIQWLRADTIKLRKPVPHYLGVGKDGLRFGYGFGIDVEESLSQRLSLFVVGHWSVSAVPKIVEHANMMNEPEYLVRMRKHIRRRAKANDPICRLRQVDHAVGRNLLQEILRTIDEGQIEPLDLMAVLSLNGAPATRR